MKWYFCFNDRVAVWLEDMIKVCVTSAISRAQLEPHCIYDGNDNALTSWLEHQGVILHRRRVQFWRDLLSEKIIELNRGSGYDPHAARGFYLLFEIPEVEQDQEIVLYTDVDVIFRQPWDLVDMRPESVAACGEVLSVHDRLPPSKPLGFNSGVMLLNVARWRQDLPNLIDEMRQNGFYGDGAGVTYDQWILNKVYGTSWDRLPDVYNWRAFWEPKNSAVLIHFHGPKPRQVREFISGHIEQKDLIGEILHSRANTYDAYLEEYDRLLVIANR